MTHGKLKVSIPEWRHLFPLAVGIGRGVSVTRRLALGCIVACLLGHSWISAARADVEAWRSWGGVPGVSSSVHAQTAWDPDGDGPLAPQIVIGGAFRAIGSVTVNGVARWDGEAWLPFGEGLSDTVEMLTTWDPDGPGPQNPQLVAAGNFSRSGNAQTFYIAWWNGSSWQPFGAGLGRSVFSVTTWDPDGDGPLTEQLVAGGTFTESGNTRVDHVARWDGTVWRGLGTGVNGTVSGLTSWDPDDAGPLPPRLVATGQFVTAGGVTVNKIAAWDGTAWHAFGSGMDGTFVFTATTWDPDGSGPERSQLVACGSFSRAGDVEANGIARWDGSAWQAFGMGMSGEGSNVSGLTTWDVDGPGPLTPQLIAGGRFEFAGGVRANGVACWDGTAWRAMGPGMNPESSRAVSELTPWDSDGDGHAERLVAAGSFTVSGGVVLNNIASWDGTGWRRFGLGLDGQVYALVSWENGLTGMQPSQLVAGGAFNSAGNVETDAIAGWDGSAWRPLGAGLDSVVMSLMTWDPDEAGVLPSRLVAGGFFTASGTTALNQIASWDGSAWEAFGAGFNGAVRAMTLWDPDGIGPAPAQIVAAGDFTLSAGLANMRISRWDGTMWRPFGSGMDDKVHALATWDPDGSGPRGPELVAGGRFRMAGGTPVNRIARWDGSEWLPLGAGLESFVYAMTTWDPDGPGPEHSQIVAAGIFTSSGETDLNYIGRWDGTAWHPFGPGVSHALSSLCTWDPDGSGPAPTQLVAGGDHYWVEDLVVRRVARWDGAAWHAFGTGMSSTVNALVSWDPDGDRPGHSQVVAGGLFRTAGDRPAGFLAIWGDTDPFAPMPPCSADFNGDGFVDFLDFGDYVGCFETGECPVGSSADFNADGFVDFFDYGDFVTAFETGC